MIQEAISRLVSGKDLSRQETVEVMTEIADGKATPAQMGAFLVALRLKGETVEEIAGAASVMRSRAEGVRVKAPVFVDTCGTGGDGQNTFNISTTAAFVVAAAGVPVAKHGNRSVSSRCGSADVLAALGVNIEIETKRIERCIDEVGIGFCFAPKHHPAFKAVAPVRKELGVRTVFNLLGPLANPAGARHQVMGVYDAKWVPVIGRVLQVLGAQKAFVVHGHGMDEIAVTGETELCEVTPSGTRSLRLTPEELGLKRWAISDLAGGDATFNAKLARDVLNGASGAPRDAVLANAAAAILAGGKADDWRGAISVAAKAIDSGAATATLEKLVAMTRAAAA